LVRTAGVVTRALASLVATLSLCACGGSPHRPTRSPDGQQDALSEAIALHDAGRHSEAIEIYRELLEKKPNDHLASYELALSYMATGDYAGCIEHATRASQAQQTRALALTLLGSCRDDAGQTQDAIAAFAEARALSPDDATLNFNYAIALGRTGDLERARELLRAVIESEPDYASPYFFYAATLQADGAIGAAVYGYLRFLSLEPRSQRAAEASRAVAKLLYAQLDRQSRHIAIARPASVTAEDPNMLTALNVALATSAANGEGSREPSADRAVAALSTFVQIGAELQANAKDTPSFALDHFVPSVHALESWELRALLFQLAAHADLDGASAWLAAHSAEAEQTMRRLSSPNRGRMRMPWRHSAR
jgi:tetratricopeptide (TPR) repeat protein